MASWTGGSGAGSRYSLSRTSREAKSGTSAVISGASGSGGGSSAPTPSAPTAGEPVASNAGGGVLVSDGRGGVVPASFPGSVSPTSAGGPSASYEPNTSTPSGPVYSSGVRRAASTTPNTPPGVVPASTPTNTGQRTPGGVISAGPLPKGQRTPGGVISPAPPPQTQFQRGFLGVFGIGGDKTNEVRFLSPEEAKANIRALRDPGEVRPQQVGALAGILTGPLSEVGGTLSAGGRAVTSGFKSGASGLRSATSAGIEGGYNLLGRLPGGQRVVNARAAIINYEVRGFPVVKEAELFTAATIANIVGTTSLRIGAQVTRPETPGLTPGEVTAIQDDARSVSITGMNREAIENENTLQSVQRIGLNVGNQVLGELSPFGPGREQGFENEVRRLLQERGVQGQELEAAVQRAKAERNTLGYAEVAGLIITGAQSEITGQVGTAARFAYYSSKNVAVSGLRAARAAAPSLVVAGAQEGINQQLVQNILRGENPSKGVFVGGTFGAVSAPTLGGGVIAFKTSEMQRGVTKLITPGNVLNAVVNIADISEKPGDIAADIYTGVRKSLGFGGRALPTYSTTIRPGYSVSRNTPTKGGTVTESLNFENPKTIFSFSTTDPGAGSPLQTNPVTPPQRQKMPDLNPVKILEPSGGGRGMAMGSVNIGGGRGGAAIIGVPINVGETSGVPSAKVPQLTLTQSANVPSPVKPIIPPTDPVIIKPGPIKIPQITIPEIKQPVPVQTPVPVLTGVPVSLPVVVGVPKVPPPLPFDFKGIGGGGGGRGAGRKYVNELLAGSTIYREFSVIGAGRGDVLANSSRVNAQFRKPRKPTKAARKAARKAAKAEKKNKSDWDRFRRAVL